MDPLDAAITLRECFDVVVYVPVTALIVSMGLNALFITRDVTRYVMGRFYPLPPPKQP